MMTPIFLSPQNNDHYFNLNQHQDYDHLEDHPQRQFLLASSSLGSTTTASSINFSLDQGLMMSATHSMSDQSQPFDQQEPFKSIISYEESSSYGAQLTNTNHYGSDNHDLFIFKHLRDDHEQNNTSGGMTNNHDSSSLKWMSSKMRMMRKMMNSNGPRSDLRAATRISNNINYTDHGPEKGINTENAVRVCSDCSTTRTPLWRSGPHGPKSLCNACGIRQRKARKAAMEAAAAAAASNAGGEESSSTSTKIPPIKLVLNKEKNKSRPASSASCVSQHSTKKQTPCKPQANQLMDDNVSNSSTNSSSKRHIRFEDFALNLLSKNASFNRMFPKDEEEGALLLMALSCGLIHS